MKGRGWVTCVELEGSGFREPFLVFWGSVFRGSSGEGRGCGRCQMDIPHGIHSFSQGPYYPQFILSINLDMKAAAVLKKNSYLCLIFIMAQVIYR